MDIKQYMEQLGQQARKASRAMARADSATRKIAELGIDGAKDD